MAAYGTGGKPPYKVMGNPIIAKPGEVCSETYIVCGSFNTLKEAKNLEMYMSTKFFRLNVLVAWLDWSVHSVPVLSSPHCIEKGKNDLFFSFAISEGQIVYCLGWDF